MHPSSARRLTDTQTYQLCLKAQAGDIVARNRLIESNLKLVTAVAHRLPGIPMEDRCGEGCLGLAEAIMRYNGNVSFASFAMWWIRKYIVLARHNEHDTPAFVQELLPKLKRAAHWLGGDPSLIGQETGIHPLRVREIIDSERVPLESDPAWHEEVSIEHLDVERAMRSLEQREAQVLSMLFGLGDANALTVNETAKLTGLKASEIERIRETAVQKLRQVVC